MRHANLGRAVELGAGNWCDETRVYAAELDRLWPADRDLAAWLAALEAFDAAVRGRGRRRRSGTFRRLGS